MKSMSGENDGSPVLSSIRSIEAISVAEKSSTPLPPWKCKGAKKTAVGNNLDVVISGPPAPAEDRDDNLTVLSSMTTLAAFSLLFTYTCLALFPLPRVQIWGSVAANFETKAASKLAARKRIENGRFRNYICSFEIRRLLLPRKSNLACRLLLALRFDFRGPGRALVSKLRPRISNLAGFRVVHLRYSGLLRPLNFENTTFSALVYFRI